MPALSREISPFDAICPPLLLMLFAAICTPFSAIMPNESSLAVSAVLVAPLLTVPFAAILVKPPAERIMPRLLSTLPPLTTFTSPRASTNPLLLLTAADSRPTYPPLIWPLLLFRVPVFNATIPASIPTVFPLP